MSFQTGEGQEGGNNEDVEADEAVRTSEARLDDEVEDDIDYGAYVDSQTAIQNATDDEGVLPSNEEELEARREAEEIVDDTYLQPSRHYGETAPESGSYSDQTTPLVRSPIGSPADSGSIPDDTPSRVGSIISSSHRGGSPSPRKSISRTASGALRPFERRFETRLSTSPSGSSRPQSPAFLTPHSRQISVSSHLSGISSQAGDSETDTPQAPWDVVRWTKLRKLTGQAFSEAGKRNFGRPTCMAVSALIAVGTSKGLVLGFDYHQTLKIIIGQGTKATECGSVTALAIAADYSTIASGHANGHIFTWEINRPARPFLQIPPLDFTILQQPQHPHGHLNNSAILHIGFLGTRHTALVSADSAGMAFSHLATRGLGPVTRTINTARLLGRYPAADTESEHIRKPSSVLAFSPLPLGNVEQATDDMGLTAMLTPYLLVIVSTTPIAQTQHKSSRPKEISPHGTLSGCLAWFPAVKLKSPSVDAAKGNSNTKLVYCWSNVLTVLDVEVTAEQAADSEKPPSLEFHPRSRWRADEAIVAVQWLGRSVLGVLTISQRLLIVEDGTLQVTDSIDLLHRHIYHQDLFSRQLHAVVEQLNSEDPSLHGVVADAFYMSYKVYKGRAFLLGFADLTVGSLSNWADRLIALMEAGDHIAAIRLATGYYSGSANNVTIGLPDNDARRHALVKERLLAMISASLNYTFSQQDSERSARLQELTEVCFEACICMHEEDYLFSDVFEWFQEAEEESIFVSTMESYVLDGEIKVLPPEVVKALVSHLVSENQAARLEELLCRLDPRSFDLDEITTLCRQHGLYDALIYSWSQALKDYVTPIIDLLSLIKMLLDGEEAEDVTSNPFYDSAIKVFPFLAYSLTGRRYPNGDMMEDNEALQAKIELYDYLFAGTPVPWPQESKKIFRTVEEADEEPAYPYLDLLLHFDTASFMSMLNEAFEDPFLNEPDEHPAVNGTSFVNGKAGRTGGKKSRQRIIEIMLDVMQQGDFEPEQMIYVDMFVARSLPKYPGQLILSGSRLDSVLQRLCQAPFETLRADCQLSVEYLLSAYHPPNMLSLIEALRGAEFFHVLKSVYRGERMFTELLEAYFEDPHDKERVFDSIKFSLQPSTNLNPKQITSVKQVIIRHIQELANIDTVTAARTLANCAPDLLQSSIESISSSYQQFVFLRSLLEPSLLRNQDLSSSPLPLDQQSIFSERYVQLMCMHDPTHVADYIKLLPTSDLRLEKVLPAMENSGVVDAAVAILARDGLARDAMDRLIVHVQSLQNALTSLINAAPTGPDLTASQQTSDDLVEDLEKYTKVGIWLCQGQSVVAPRRPRPRMAVVQDVDENDLELDEYLWLLLVDAVVQITQNAFSALEHFDSHPTEHASDAFDSSKLASSLRSNVQQTFTALMAATATPTISEKHTTAGQSKQPADHLRLLRVLRAFLTRAARTSPSLSHLRAVLSDIFSAYTFEQGVLSLANELLGSDVFAEIEEANTLRQRGWRPRSQVCEICKRRAWGPGIGEVVWDEWEIRERERETEKSRKMLERGGGEQARRLSRGKAKASASTSVEREQIVSEETKRLVLVVFACRHIFHRVCLDDDYKDGKPLKQESYRCSMCIVDRK